MDWPASAKWGWHDTVQKKRGSSWRGRVVGFYSTEHTPIGYNVESLHEPGSVQCWPEAALEEWAREAYRYETRTVDREGWGSFKVYVIFDEDGEHVAECETENQAVSLVSILNHGG